MTEKQKYKITGGYVELKNPDTGEVIQRVEIKPSKIINGKIKEENND